MEIELNKENTFTSTLDTISGALDKENPSYSESKIDLKDKQEPIPTSADGLSLENK